MELAWSGLFLFLSLVFDLASCKLSVSLREEHKNVGETNFFVLCRDPENGAKVVWRNPKNKLINNRPENNVIKQDTTHGSQLIFKTIRKEDEGVYNCRSNKDQIEFQLFVEDPMEFVNTPTVVKGKEGSDVVMNCEARNGDPQILVDGNKPTNDTKYRVLGDGLLILNASVEDTRHQYICQAMNLEKGTFKTIEIFLVINHPPRLKNSIYEKENIVYGFLGGTVNLTCAVEAQPEPDFKWFRNNRHKIIGQKKHMPDPRVSVLSVYLENSKDFGEYKCEASNSEGTLVTSFSLIMGNRPEPPELIELVTADSTSLSIYIEPPNSTKEEDVTETLEPSGFLVEYRPLEEPYWNAQSFTQLAEDNTYILTNLTKNTTYQVRVATLNAAGLSTFTNETEYSTTSLAVTVKSSIFTFLLLFTALKVFI